MNQTKSRQKAAKQTQLNDKFTPKNIVSPSGVAFQVLLDGETVILSDTVNEARLPVHLIPELLGTLQDIERAYWRAY